MKKRFKIPQVGDIFRAPSGVLRTVRAVRMDTQMNPRKIIVAFSILHCSWTHRCYTVYSIAELRGIGYTHLAQRRKFNDPFEKELNRVISASSTEMDCCDVKGIS